MYVVDGALWTQLARMQLRDVVLFCHVSGLELDVSEFIDCLVCPSVELQEHEAVLLALELDRIAVAEEPLFDPSITQRDFAVAWLRVVMLEIETLLTFIQVASQMPSCVL